MSPYWLSSNNDAWMPYRAMEIELTAESTRGWIVLMHEGGRIMPVDSTVTVGIEIPETGGEGYVMFTGLPFQRLIDDDATGTIWKPGSVTETRYTCFPSITGIRPVWVSGTITVVIGL